MLRVIVQRISDRAFLDLELPVKVDSIKSTFGADGSFKASLQADKGGQRYADGSMYLEPHAVFLHVEEDSLIRGSFLLTRSELDGDEWVIEGRGFSAILDRPFEGNIYAVQRDPIGIAREIVEHVQSFSNAAYGVSLVGSSSVRVGSGSEDTVKDLTASVKSLESAKESAASALAAARKKVSERREYWSGQIASLEATAKSKRNAYAANKTAANKSAANAAAAAVESAKASRDTDIAARQATVTAKDNALKAARADLAEAKTSLAAAKKTMKSDGGAWKVQWWDSPNCLEQVSSLVSEAGMEWVEWSGWNADRSDVLLEIRCVDRVGSRRDDLRFTDESNITEQVSVVDNGTDYANVVIALGAGEGAEALRVTVGASDGARRRVPVVLDAKSVTSKKVLRRRAEAELAARMRRFSVSAIRVDVTHPNALWGTFTAGDTILVDCVVGWAGRQRLWHRISAVDWDGEGIADLSLEVA